MASRCAFCQYNHYGPGVRILTPNGVYCIIQTFIPPSLGQKWRIALASQFGQP